MSEPHDQGITLIATLASLSVVIAVLMLISQSLSSDSKTLRALARAQQTDLDASSHYARLRPLAGEALLEPDGIFRPGIPEFDDTDGVITLLAP